ncbi:MAG: aldo/keto reductase, partial [Anaerolineae bacterium]
AGWNDVNQSSHAEATSGADRDRGQVPFTRRMMLQRDMERSQPVIEVLDRIATERGVTPALVAPNWLVNFQGETVVAIPGASKALQARDSASAMAFRLSDGEMAQLDAVSRVL